MQTLIIGVGLVAVVALTRAGARRAGWPAPILLLIVGVAAGFVPGLPAIRLNPDLALLVVLPVLLYASAFTASVPAFRAQRRPILLLSVGLTLFTTVVVGYVAYLVVPGLPLAAGMVLGAMVAPPDAISATAVGRRVGMPSTVLTMLEGESLFNDAAAMTAYRVAVAAAVSGTFNAWNATGLFLLAAVGGIAVGVAAAWMIGRIRVHIRHPLSDTALSLLAPFFAFIPAEAIHTSGLVAVVVAGLALGHRAPVRMYAETRLIAQSVWRMIQYLLEGVVFLLIGLQLPQVIGGLEPYSPTALAVVSVAIVTTVVVSRFVWIFPAAYLPRLLRRVRQRERRPPWQQPALASWAGMRGVVSLAAAFALPASISDGRGFPHRDLLLFLTFIVIVATLFGQGLTLPAVIRRLGLPGRGKAQRLVMEAKAQQAATDAAVHRLDELLAHEDPPPQVVTRLRTLTDERRAAAWERTGTDGISAPTFHAYRRLRQEMLTAERAAIVRLRDDGSIDEEVLQRMQRGLDLEEAALRRCDDPADSG